jgi:hypothetical protein
MRRRLANRRINEVFDTEFRGQAFRIAFTRWPDGGIGEVFVDPAKTSSDAAEDSRDVGLVLSVSLQHSVPIEALRASVSRERDYPTSLSGHILDLLAAECGGGAHDG